MEDPSLGPVYIVTLNVSVNAAMTLATLLSLNTMVSKWVAYPFWSDSIVVNERSVASVIALILTLNVNGPLTGFTSAFLFHCLDYISGEKG